MLGAALKPHNIIIYTKKPSYITIPQYFYSSSGIGILLNIAFISNAEYTLVSASDSNTLLHLGNEYAGNAILIEDK